MSELRKRTDLGEAAATAQDQVTGVILAGGRATRMGGVDNGAFGCEVIDDGDSEFRGPLAGMMSGMRTARTPWLAIVPCDSPLIHADLVGRLYEAAVSSGSPIAAAHDGERLQPVFALIACSLLDDLAGYLDDGERKIDRWYARHGYASVDFSDVAESFANINAPDDKRRLEATLAQRARPDRT
jgi:molybdopterin-guanine dinucleotide biosynthesis protein A